MAEDEWRNEADEQWLAEHRSKFFKRRRSALGQAVSQAEIGPFGGAPRNPDLTKGFKAYSTIRNAYKQASYTEIRVTTSYCRTCGTRSLQLHRLSAYVGESDRQATFGQLEMCSKCDEGSWLFTVHGPRTEAARARARKTVI